MIIPIRCYTCNQLVANKWAEYNKIVNNEPSGTPKAHDPGPSKALVAFEKLAIRRVCCRRHFLGHVDLIDVI